ncbi:DUF2752 domain-containing protein [Antribacter gilvus]|uniref:DUF2752 domain-containing protein n=1 Tax=Antribacter gilvus TaxID=2304675 RepID=UPI00197CDA04|nr:DUF2752 domain-containing protein [Antribacter gilvus]
MPTATTPFLGLQAEQTDRHRWLTGGATLALGAAILMAVFGLPPVDLHGPLHLLGIMDPFCGGTRAARYAALGNLVEAWRYNPLSIVIVYGALTAVVRAGVGLVTRRWFTLTIGWTPVRRRWVIAVALVLLVLLEVRQQLRADLLMAGTSTWP